MQKWISNQSRRRLKRKIPVHVSWKSGYSRF